MWQPVAMDASEVVLEVPWRLPVATSGLEVAVEVAMDAGLLGQPSIRKPFMIAGAPEQVPAKGTLCHLKALVPMGITQETSSGGSPGSTCQTVQFHVLEGGYMTWGTPIQRDDSKLKPTLVFLGTGPSRWGAKKLVGPKGPMGRTSAVRPELQGAKPGL